MIIAHSWRLFFDVTPRIVAAAVAAVPIDFPARNCVMNKPKSFVLSYFGAGGITL